MFHVKFEPLRGEEVAIVLHLGEGYHFIIKEQCGTKKNSAACSHVHKQKMQATPKSFILKKQCENKGNSAARSYVQEKIAVQFIVGD